MTTIIMEMYAAGSFQSYQCIPGWMNDRAEICHTMKFFVQIIYSFKNQ